MVGERNRVIEAFATASACEARGMGGGPGGTRERGLCVVVAVLGDRLGGGGRWRRRKLERERGGSGVLGGKESTDCGAVMR